MTFCTVYCQKHTHSLKFNTAQAFINNVLKEEKTRVNLYGYIVIYNTGISDNSSVYLELQNIEK